MVPPLASSPRRAREAVSAHRGAVVCSNRLSASVTGQGASVIPEVMAKSWVRAAARLRLGGLVVMMGFAWQGSSASVQGVAPGSPSEVLVKYVTGASAGDQAQVDVDADAQFDEQVAQVAGGTIHRIRSRSRSTDELVR